MRSDCYSKMLDDFINTLYRVRHHYKIDITKVQFVHFEIRFYHKIQCNYCHLPLVFKRKMFHVGFFCAQVVIAKCLLNSLMFYFVCAIIIKFI